MRWRLMKNAVSYGKDKNAEKKSNDIIRKENHNVYIKKMTDLKIGLFFQNSNGFAFGLVLKVDLD